MDVAAASARALAYLAMSQLPTGAFPVYIWSDPPELEPLAQDACVFPTAVIGCSLQCVRTPEATRMVDRAMAFLQDEMEAGGVWRFWSSDSPRHRGIPPDLDDMACASVALRTSGRVVPDNRHLILANRDRSGRFFTWLAPRLQWNHSLRYWQIVLRQLAHPRRHRLFWQGTARPDDVDCVVNANILRYLGRGPWALPVIELLVDAIRRGLERRCDKSYPSSAIVYYFISRCYASGVVELAAVRDAIVGRLLGVVGRAPGLEVTPLEMALAISAALDWDADTHLDGAIAWLIGQQQDDGAWRRDVVNAGGYWRWGSEAWTTAFCVEALARYADRRGGM